MLGSLLMFLNLSVHVLLLGSESCHCRVSLREYQFRNHPAVVRPLDVSTQTRCRNLPPFQYPVVPETQGEIHSYLHWLDMLSLFIQQQRKAAETKLQSFTSSSPAQLAEREKQRKLEADNLCLRKEIADLKAVNILFPEL